MKSQFRCILFALIAMPAACRGDHSTTSSGQATLVPALAAPSLARDASVEPVVTPAPVAVVPAKPEAVAPVPGTYGDALAQGKALAAAGDVAGARAMFEVASKLDRKVAAPHIELARLFIASGERGLAIAAANKAVKRAPGSSQAYNTLGRAELARWSYDNAIIAFRKATELDAGNAWAWNNLGFTYLQLEQYQEAADALVEATKHAGAEGYMWNNLGTAYEHLDQLDDARAAFEQGGKAGSKEAVASRKRLEGVETIVVMRREPAVDVPATAGGYELSEPMPEVEPAPAAEADPPPGSDAADAVEAAVTPEPAVAPDDSVPPADAESPAAPPVEQPAAPATL